MEETELELKKLIIEKYGSLKKFCELINMPWTTLDSILKRGIANANITNVMKITKELCIDTESLASGIIKNNIETDHPSTIAAHLDTEDLSSDEIADVAKYIEFIKQRRNK